MAGEDSWAPLLLAWDMHGAGREVSPRAETREILSSHVMMRKQASPVHHCTTNRSAEKA